MYLNDTSLSYTVVIGMFTIILHIINSFSFELPKLRRSIMKDLTEDLT